MNTPPGSPSVSVAVPVLNAMAFLPALLPALRAQRPAPPAEIVLVDSGSTDGSREFAARAGPDVLPVDLARFSHGGSRNLAARLARGEFIVFLSQDAIPRDDAWLANLLAPFRRPDVAAAFSRQIPRPDANPLQRFFLSTHFPPESAAYRRDPSRPDLFFQRDVFFSNVSSAARRNELLRHPFDESLVMSEDQQFARDLLLAGLEVAYAADSVVLHSHNYTFLGALRRYFDSAFSLTQIFRRHDLSQSARMGSSYLRREASMMLRNHPLLLPRYAAYVLAKTLGTVLGHFADRLPLCLVRRLSLHSAYWPSPPSTQPHPPSSP